MSGPWNEISDRQATGFNALMVSWPSSSSIISNNYLSIPPNPSGGDSPRAYERYIPWAGLSFHPITSKTKLCLTFHHVVASFLAIQLDFFNQICLWLFRKQIQFIGNASRSEQSIHSLFRFMIDFANFFKQVMITPHHEFLLVKAVTRNITQYAILSFH